MSFYIDEIKLLIKEILHEKIGEKEFLYEHLHQWKTERPWSRFEVKRVFFRTMITV